MLKWSLRARIRLSSCMVFTTNRVSNGLRQRLTLGHIDQVMLIATGGPNDSLILRLLAEKKPSMLKHEAASPNSVVSR